MPKPFTPDTAQKAQENAAAQRMIYNRQFLEEDRWKELAKESGYPLPPFFARPSDSAIKAALRKLELSWNDFMEAYGWESAAHFEYLNPEWGMRPLTGLILELWDEKRRMKDTCYGAAIVRGAVPGGAKPKKQRMPRGVAKSKRPPLKVTTDSQDVVG